MSRQLGVSVIVCCYNSRERIRPTLEHLAVQDFPNILMEVILVDNGSSDGTADYARSIWAGLSSNIPLHILHQPAPGLSAAREMGCSSANYSYIIFCDDDNWLDKNYVQRAFDIMEGDSTIGALGGKIQGVSDVPFPSWWDEKNDSYAVGEQAAGDGDVTQRMYLWGAGMVVRADLMDNAFNKKFPLLLSDRNGKNITSGGDSEICLRIILLGYKLYYSNALILKHFISANRLQISYADSLRNSFISSAVVLQKYHDYIYYQRNPRTVKLYSRLFHMMKFGLHKLRIRKMNHNSLNLTSIVLESATITPDPDYKRIIEFSQEFNNRKSHYQYG